MFLLFPEYGGDGVLVLFQGITSEFPSRSLCERCVEQLEFLIVADAFTGDNSGRELTKSEESERSEEPEEVEEHLFVPSLQLTFISDGDFTMVCGWALE